MTFSQLSIVMRLYVSRWNRLIFCVCRTVFSMRMSCRKTTTQLLNRLRNPFNVLCWVCVCEDVDVYVCIYDVILQFSSLHFFRYQRSILTSIYYGFIEKWKWSDILHSFHSIDVKLIGNDNSSKLNANFFRKILYISRSRIHVYYVQCTLDDNKGAPLSRPHTHTHAHNRLIHSVIHGAFVVCLMDFLQDCRQKNKEWTLIFKPFNGRIC